MRGSLYKQRHANWQQKINISFLLPIFILKALIVMANHLCKIVLKVMKSVFFRPKHTKQYDEGGKTAFSLSGRGYRVALLLLLALITSATALLFTVSPAQAATSSTLNFQGRLATNTGGLVSDGSYNIEFKLYDDATAGSNLWTESRTGGNQVTVRNGYFSVYLGEVTPFGASIPWDQELWLTMNVNGDGEMSPRFKLTAVPYAFRAGALVDSGGTAKTADDFAQLAPSGVQAVNSALAALRLNQTGVGALLQLQGDGSDVFIVDKTGSTVLGSGITVGNSTNTTAGTIRWSGSDLEVYNGITWVSLTSGGGGSITLGSNIKAYGKVDGATGNALNISGASVVRNSVGNYTVTLNSALPDVNYSILATLEDSATDDSNIAITAQTTSSFTVNIGVGDNGATADVASDRNWHFVVIDDSSGGGTEVFVQSGNSFGVTAVLGTTDTNGLQIITDSNVALDFSSTGAATFNNGLTINAGGLNLNNGDVVGVDDITANTFTGSGSGLTDLSGDEITTGTIVDARLSSNISRLDTASSYSATQTFTGGAVLGNFTSTSAGAVRWTGTDFEGFDGTQWLSFTSGSSSGAPAAATFYDSTGGATIAAGVFSTINLDATLDNSDPTIVDVVGDVVTVTEDGYYEISYQVSSRLNSGTRSGFNAKLQLDTGGGYVDVAGSQSFHYGRITSEPAGTSSATAILSLSAGDSIRVQGQGVTQSFVTVADGSSLSIAKVTSASGGGGGGGLSFEQNGNTFGATAILGTIDAFGLRLVSNTVNSLEFDTSGLGTFSQLTTFSNGIDISSGGLDLSSGNITGVSTLTATSIVADGSGLTDLNGSEITSGSISSARLSSDVALLNANQTFTGLPTFSSGLTLGSSASTTAGTIRWSGSDFEGFDGIQWVSLTQSASVSSPLLEGVLAFGKINGSTGAGLSLDGASVVRNGTGNYTVTLDTPATTANYVIQLTVEETAANLDDINISVDSQTTSGFNVDIREGDNSTTADTPIDKNWHFIVFDADAVAGGGSSGGGTSFTQGGNDFSGTAILGTSAGTSDGLTFITDGSAAILVDALGDTTFVNDVTLNGALTLGTLPTPDAAAQASIFSGGTTNKGLIIQGAASQVENLFEIQDNAGNLLSGFDSGGGLVLGLSTITSSASGSQTVSFGNESGTVCLSGSTNCGFLPLAAGTYVTDATTNNTLAINKTAASGNIISLQKNGGAVFTVSNTGSLQIQSTDSAALDIRNVGGTSYFSVDTNTGIVRIGPTTADALGVLLLLDTKNDAGDPTGTDGGIYYNSSSGKFRCYEDGIWKDCIGARQVRSFVDTTADAAADNNTTNYWDIAVENNNSVPNLSPSTANKSVTGSVTFETQSSTTADRSIVARVERSIGTPAACNSGTPVGTILSTFTTNNGEQASNTMIFLDSPNTMSVVYYTLCADTATSNAGGMTINRIRISLEEANNSN